MPVDVQIQQSSSLFTTVSTKFYSEIRELSLRKSLISSDCGFYFVVLSSTAVAA